MTGWLLDTNVLSELRKPRPDPKVVSFIASQQMEQLHVSAVTFAEIRCGIELIKDTHRRVELNDWLGQKLRPMFQGRTLPVSEDVMFKWRLMVEEGRKQGHTFGQPDLIIAATAAQHGLTIVSRDTSQYAKARTPWVNPWKQQTG